MDSVRRRQQGDSSRSLEDPQEGVKGNTGGVLMQKVVMGGLCLVLLLMLLYEFRAKAQLESSFAEQTMQLQAQILQLQQRQPAVVEANHEIECPLCPKCPDVKMEEDVSSAKLTKQLAALKKQKTRMEEALQRSARDTLVSKYGSGPIYVDLTLRLPQEVSDGSSAVLRLEMAPAELMPVTVLYFLEQVTSGAWDGCSFIRNAGHVLQASPRGKNCNVKAFRASGGKERSVAFQEYSSQYPHYMHTIGLAGRPGGPDFYINLMDNVDNHGPGGQSNCK